LDGLRARGALLSGASKEFADGQAMKKAAHLSSSDAKRGVIDAWDGDGPRYELRSAVIGQPISSIYELYEGDERILRTEMDYGAEGPVIDARIVAGRPAFTFQLRRPTGYGTDIFYDGGRFSETYRVTDPKYLFYWGGKFGFIARDSGGERVFFDGRFITPAFESIHTRDCCADTGILPTVYEDGILLFSGTREGKSFLAEVSLD